MQHARLNHRKFACPLVCLCLAWALSSVAMAQQEAPETPDLQRLATRLSSDSRCERLAASRELSAIEAPGAAVVLLLRQGLQDTDLAVRLTCTASLSRAASLSPEVAEGFRAALRDPSDLVRQFGVRSLGCVRDASRARAEMLEAASRDMDEGVRTLAGGQLRAIEGMRTPSAADGEGGVPVGDGSAAPAESSQRPGAARPPGAGGSEPPGAGARPAPGAQSAAGEGSVDDVIARLDDASPEIRLQTAEALGKMGVSAIKALPALELARTDADARVRKMAEWAIAQIWRPKPPATGPAQPPPEGRIFFLTDIVIDCDERGPVLNDEIICESPSSTADLFQFTTLSYLDLAEVRRYRDNARKRGLPAHKPLAELVSTDPDWEELMAEFAIAKPYLEDHVVAVVCNGQTRFLHRRFSADGELHEWGGGEHWGMENGRHKATVHVFTVEGFRLAFEFEFTFVRDGRTPAHLAALKGPADVSVASRQLLLELEADEKAAAESEEEGARERTLEFRRQRAERLSGLAGTLWATVRDLTRHAAARPDDVAPYIADASAAQALAHDLNPLALKDWSTLGEMAYAYHVMNEPEVWPHMIRAMVWYEAALRGVSPASTDFWDRQAWCGWASAWYRLAQSAITHRNDVDRFRAYQSHWLSLSDKIVDSHSGGPLELGTSKDPDTWPQPGWWRAEWNGLVPADLPEWEPEEEPEPAIAADEERRELFSALDEVLAEIDRDRALEKRWADGLWESVRTAERKKTEAVSLLRAQAEVARAMRARIAHLQGLLAKLPETESATYLEAALKFGIDFWDDAWGPKPQPTDRADAVIQRLIADLTRQQAQVLAEQEQLITETLGTYYDGIIDEAEAKGAKAEIDESRDTATRVIKDTQVLRALAKAELFLASGEDDPFRTAAREAIAAGVPEYEVRMLEAVYFHQKGDVRHALHGYRKVVELTLGAGADTAPLSEGEAQRLLSSKETGLADRARAMAWTLEHAYLKAIDAKAEGEAAELRGELDQRLEKGGEKGWLGAVVGFLKMGVVSGLSAATGREDSLEGLASQFQNDVARQHCGTLLVQSLHERGVSIKGLEGLSNDDFMKLIRTVYPEAGDSVDAGDALRMRASIKAAFANVDVKRLADVPKQMLNVDTGTPYFEKEDYQETALEWWGDTINIANVLTWLGPGAAWRVGGEVEWFPNWGWIGEARQAGAVVVTAKEAVAAGIGASRLPALLAQSKPGQILVEQFARFFSQSTWIQERGLDMAMQLAVGKVGEATGGTLGVLTGSDGRAEAEAGRLFAELLAAWGAGDADVTKKIMIEHGITTGHLRKLLDAARETAVSARAAGELGAEHSRGLRKALEEISEGAPSAETRALLGSSGEEIRRLLEDAGAQFRRGEPGLGWERLEELRIAREAYAAAEAGAIGEARVWRELLDQRVQEWAVRTKQAARAMQELDAMPGTRQVGSPATARDPVSFRQHPSRLTEDLDRLVIKGEYDTALVGCQQRLALLRQLGAGDTPQVQMLAEKARRLRTIADTRRRFATSAAGPDEGHTRPVSPEDVALLDASPGVAKVRMALPGEEASYSDPYWVWRKGERGLEKDGVFKGSGEGFSDHYDLRAEEVYASVGEIVGVDVPACTRARMTIGGQVREGIYLRNAKGTCLKYMSPEAQIALKPQIARDRVLAAFLGDHDRHMGNYLVTRNGKVISIDHGMADVCGKRLNENSPLADGDTFRTAMKHRIVDMGRGKHYNLTFIDEHMTIEDMLPTIREIETLCSDLERLRGVLGKHLSGIELEDAMQVLPARAKVLRQVLEECFGTTRDLKPIPVPSVSPTATLREDTTRDGCSRMRAA